MTRTPTDREILRAIYELYYAEFVDFDDKPHSRATKVYVPIDVPAVAKSISVDPEIVFGRLHYHLQSKYGRKDGEWRCRFSKFSSPAGTRVSLSVTSSTFPCLTPS